MDTDRNEVLLEGRVSSVDEPRTLPSGDEIVTFRVVVTRPPGSAGRAGHDAVDCTAWRAPLRRKVLALRVSDRVEVTGMLQRRFWRSPAGTASRTEVDVRTVRRLARATMTE